ncbi:uncharacterized protein olf186-M isoform X2 [Periplaneta americana]|uniref:uncharacterized protein olf186-M isoform X2 n=1 Tax=Periplaneta americana TaxID=6978 RepID=UPI0037E7DD70
MDTGDSGHSAWFQSRVQVLVRSLRTHQGGTAPQWSEEPSTSSPPPQRRSLHLGRSLASRWQQYSPGPLRRLKKLFSVSSERELHEQDDVWDSDSDSLKKDKEHERVDKDSESSPLLHYESPTSSDSKDLSDFEPSKELEDTNSSLNKIHQNVFQDLTVSDHTTPIKCPQQFHVPETASSSDSRNIPGDPLVDKSNSNANVDHIPALFLSTEVSRVSTKNEAHNSIASDPGIFDTSKADDGAWKTSNSHSFNKDFYVLIPTPEEDEVTEEDRECWQQDAMTQWRRVDDDASTVKGQATDVEGCVTYSAEESKDSAIHSGHSDSDTSCHVENNSLLRMNGKLDEEVEVLLSSEVGAGRSRAFDASACDVTEYRHDSCLSSVEMAESVYKIDHGTGDSGEEITRVLVEPVTVVDESSEIVSKSDMESAVIVTGVDETDRSPLSPPSIVLELPPTVEHAQLASEVATDSSGSHRPPKLQLQITASASPQPAARKSPVTVQEWVDSLPLHHRSEEEGGEEQPLEESDDHLGLGLGAEAGLLYDGLPAVNVVSPAEPKSPGSVGKVASMSSARLAREPSVQSDVTSHTGSHCSSVESFLESRRPDPEEILLGLGFGGSVGGSGVDTELSRIPRRFLQPSKVKGVEIDDYLRYQQDLIETFESGFSGYRGLTGTSHTPPSVIVAKIMEKLREHERENIPPGSVASAPVIGNTAASPSIPTASSKFSRAARRVLTRTTVLGALPYIARQQQQQQSVLTPDNRKFLDSQGNKSPEVPRKRMIIGHRSYTFGCDGDLIELDPVLPAMPPTNLPPKPKPLIHKDSVLSTATSLSLTSIDSDSDTDDHSNGFGIQNRRNIIHDHPSTSTPKSTQFSSPNLSQESLSDKHQGQRVYQPYPPPVSKRMSSTSLSSWESESHISPIHSCSDFGAGSRHRSTDGMTEHYADDQDFGLRMAMRHHSRFHSSPDSPLSSRQIRYESIDENVETRSDQSASLLSTSTSDHDQSQHNPGKKEDKNVGEQHIVHRNEMVKNNVNRTENSNIVACERDVLKSVTANNGDEENAVDNVFDSNELSHPSGDQKSTKTLEEQIQIQKNVISLLQLRRSSLKRQQRVLDEEEPLEVFAAEDLECSSHTAKKECKSVLHSRSNSSEKTHLQNKKEENMGECMCDSDVFVDEVSQIKDVHMEESNVLDSENTGQECMCNSEVSVEILTTENMEEGEPESQHASCADEHKIREDDISQQNDSIVLAVTNKLNANSHLASEQKMTDAEQSKGAENVEPHHTEFLRVVCEDTRGDSFEMEEICTYGEEEVRTSTSMLSRARSDSSGFLDGDLEIYSRHNADGTVTIESSQYDGTNSEAVCINGDTSETIECKVHVTEVPSCTVSEEVDANISDDNGHTKSENISCSSDLKSPSFSEGLKTSEINVIDQRELPDNLNLLSVNDWVSQCNTSLPSEHVGDLVGPCAIHYEQNKFLERKQTEKVNNRQFEGNSLTNSSTPRDKNFQNCSVLNTVIPCGKGIVPSETQNSTANSSDRKLLRDSVTLHQPLVCVDDKDLVRQRTMSLQAIDEAHSLFFRGVRRVRSAPHCLEHMESGDEMVQGSSWSSVSNMFSFCSDESVIHVGLQRPSWSRSEKRLSDAAGNVLVKPNVVTQNDYGLSDADVPPSDPIGSSQYLKPNVNRNTRRASSDTPSTSSRSVKDLHELVGELTLLRLQGDAVRAGLAAYGRQLVGEQVSGHEVPEAKKELMAVGEVRERIAAELRRVADLLEEQPLHKAADITGQMAVLLREQTRLCQQLEALSRESSPTVFVEPAPCCSVLGVVREENRHLLQMVEKNSQELKEIRQLLKEVLAVKKSQF